MKYTYLVIRDEPREKGVYKYPVLGVHGNLTKALRHYNSVVSDVTKKSVPMPSRKSLDLKVTDGRFVTVISYYDSIEETYVRLEKWIVKG